MKTNVFKSAQRRIPIAVAVNLAVFFCACGDTADAIDNPPNESNDAIVVENVGFMSPESILHDDQNDVYLVSNIYKSDESKDNNGFISRVSPDGSVLDVLWIAGSRNEVTLHAPKGMAIVSDTLFVADLDTLRLFNLNTGAPRESIAIDGATFINDVCSLPDGAVYISDSGSGATGGIWHYSDHAIDKLVDGDLLRNPNGLLCTPVGLWMVNGHGELIPISYAGDIGPAIQLPDNGLDGIVESADGNFFISSWDAEAVFQGTPQTDFVHRIGPIHSPADIGYDASRNRILIPVFDDDSIVIYPLP